MSFGDDAPAAEPQFTTRLAPRFRAHLINLRTCAYLIDDAAERDQLLDAVQALASDLAMGFDTRVQLTLDEARVADGIADVIDDAAGVANSDRDSRPVAAE